MSYPLRVPRTISPQEYLMLERCASFKSEYLDGRIYSMAGASFDHMRIARNLAIAIHPQLRGSGCEVLAGEMKVRTPSQDAFAYPDLTILCGKPQFHDSQTDVVLNPRVIFEILSPSTETYDRVEKFERYKDLESLMEYVLVSQSQPRIEHYARQENGLWLPTLAVGLNQSLALSSVGVTLHLAEVYEGIEFEAGTGDEKK